MKRRDFLRLVPGLGIAAVLPKDITEDQDLKAGILVDEEGNALVVGFTNPLTKKYHQMPVPKENPLTRQFQEFDIRSCTIDGSVPTEAGRICST